MASYLLDSDAVIDYLNGKAASVSLVSTLYQQGNRLYVCDVVIAEVYSGLKPPDREKARKLVDGFDFLLTSSEIARQAGEWRYSYARLGKSLSTMDCLLAATAYAHDASVVTGNQDDYPMPEVLLVALPRTTG